ncbi:MAG: insulinase family protein [Flavobacteriales bacterium]|nr:insulinase family protein [Flavobacteriales bacterium]
MSLLPNPIVFTLSNGIRVVHQPMDRDVAHCGLLIAAGSRDEEEDEHGLAHFLEHCFFKGTKTRKNHHILSRLDAVGGELNAFTAKEETWIHASMLKEHYERAIELIADITFHPSFPAEEIEKEKEVIIDELNSYFDSPSEMIFEEFDQQLFGNHAIGRSILGTKESINSVKRSTLERFRKRNLTAEQLVFSSAGNIPVEKLQALLEKHFGKEKLVPFTQKRSKPTLKAGKKIFVEKDIHQVNYLVGGKAYAYPHKLRPALTLLANVLGGPALNNKLSMVIREKYGLAYHVECTYAPFTDCGIFSLYLGTDKENLKKATDLAEKTLNYYKDNKMSSRQLHEAKKQIIGQMALAQDSGSALMFNLGKSLYLFNRIDTMQEVFRRLEEITSEQIQKAAIDTFHFEKMNVLAYVPKKN